MPEAQLAQLELAYEDVNDCRRECFFPFMHDAAKAQRWPAKDKVLLDQRVGFFNDPVTLCLAILREKFLGAKPGV